MGCGVMSEVRVRKRRARCGRQIVFLIHKSIKHSILLLSELIVSYAQNISRRPYPGGGAGQGWGVRGLKVSYCSVYKFNKVQFQPKWKDISTNLGNQLCAE